MKIDKEFQTGYVLSFKGEWLESISPEIWSMDILDAICISRDQWNVFDSKLVNGRINFVSAASLKREGKYPLRHESEADSDLRLFGLIHDAIVSIYGADSLEADTLRVIREAGVRTDNIRAGLSEALGRFLPASA